MHIIILLQINKITFKNILTNFYIVLSFAIIVSFRYNKKFECQGEDCQGLGEGCFCPEEMTLFSSNSDLCVSSCKTAPVLM